MNIKIVKYIVFIIEEYKKRQKLSGSRVTNYFQDNNIYNFIINNYEALHTQSTENVLLDINEFVKNR